MKRNAINENGKAWLKKETAPYRPSILFLCCLAIFSSIFSIAFAYTVQYLINSASKGANDRMWLFAGLILAFILLKTYSDSKLNGDLLDSEEEDVSYTSLFLRLCKHSSDFVCFLSLFYINHPLFI